MPRSFLKPDLTSELDNHILAHVFRNHLTTRAVLKRMFYDTQTMNAVSRRTSSLLRRGYLSRHSLFGKQVYFSAGRRSIRRFQLGRNAARPLPKQRLATEFAALNYCCMGEKVLKRLTSEELRCECPWYSRSMLAMHPHYFDTDELRRLACIRVELSGSAPYVVRKHVQAMYELRQNRRFDKLVSDDEFMLVLITTSAERRDALIAEIQEEKWFPTCRVLDFPRLANFL